MSHRRFSALFSALAGLMFAGLGSAARADSPVKLTAVLDGSITAKATGAPIAGAVVHAGSQTTNTNSTGKFTLSFPTAGDVHLHAEAEGFQPAETVATLVLGKTTSIALALDAKEAPKPPAQSTLTGTVTDAVTGKPIAGATVSADDSTATTDANGVYSIKTAADEHVVIKVSASGYVPAVQNVDADGDGDESASVNFKLNKVDPQAKTGTVAGTVTSRESGKPVAGAVVAAGDVSAKTDGDGKYTLTLPARLAIAVKVTADGFEPALKLTDVDAGGTDLVNFRLEALPAPPKPGTVSGTVTDSDTGKPIAGAKITAGNQSATTDAKGAYSLSLPAASHVAVTATADGYISATRHTDVDAGGNETLDFKLEKPDAKTGTVQGSVSNEAGKPIAGAIVTSGAVFTTTDEKGNFTLHSVVPGSDIVIAQARGYVTSAKTVNVTAGASVTVNFTLSTLPKPQPDQGSIEGRVISEETGKPVVGAIVHLNDRTAQTDLSGSFEFQNVAPGSVTLKVTADGYVDRSKDIRVRSENETHVTLALDAKQTAPPAETGTIAGSVTAKADGSPVAGATVSVGDQKAVTDDKGQFKLTGVPAGVSELVVSKSGFEAAERHVRVSSKDAAQVDVKLSPADQPASGGKGKISGVVYGDDKKPIAGANVMLEGARVQTDGKGAYEFDNLADGHYTLQAWAKGFRHTHKKAIIKGGDALTVDFTLHRREHDDDEDQGGDDNVGKVSGTGDVSVGDVIFVLKLALGLETADKATLSRLDVGPRKENGDFGDGKIDLRDAILLLRVAAGLELQFP